MRHSVVLSPISSLEANGRAIAQLRYDAIIVILLAMQAELRSQAAKDHLRGRPQLSSLGRQTTDDLGVVINDLRAMLKLSDSHMIEDYKIVRRLIVD